MTREVEVTRIVEVPATVEVRSEVVREVPVPYRIAASKETHAACDRFDEFLNDSDQVFRDFLDFILDDDFAFSSIRPDILQDVFLSAIQALFFYWDADPDDDEDELHHLKRSWNIIEHYCHDVIEQHSN